MTHEELHKLLTDSGFNTGWILTGDVLTLWEHDQDPPAPLTRPEDVSHEEDPPAPMTPDQE